MKYLPVLLLSLGVTGCGAPYENRTNEKTTKEVYVQPEPRFEKVEILNIKPPKHFMMEYKIISTGDTVTVHSKRCSIWNRVKVGHTYILDVTKGGCYILENVQEVVIDE